LFSIATAQIAYRAKSLSRQEKGLRRQEEVQSPYRLHGGPQTDDRSGDKESAGRRDDPRERSRSGADRQAQAASGFKGPGA